MDASTNAGARYTMIQQSINVLFNIHERCIHGGYDEVGIHVECVDVTLLGRRTTQPIRGRYKRFRLPLAVTRPTVDRTALTKTGIETRGGWLIVNLKGENGVYRRLPIQ